MADRFRITLEDGQLLVTLDFQHDPESGDLAVSINGKILDPVVEYAELGQTQIVLAAPGVSGEILEARRI